MDAKSDDRENMSDQLEQMNNLMQMMENQIEIKVSPQKQNEIPLVASQAFSNESFGSSKDVQEHEPRLMESNVGLEKQLNIQGFQFKNSLWQPS